MHKAEAGKALHVGSAYTCWEVLGEMGFATHRIK